MKASRFIPLLLFVFLVLAGASLPAQASDAPARKLTWALKVQAYQPLSWLAEPLNGKRDYPFTPRFWTGEVELGFSQRSSLQVSVGVRYRKETWLNLAVNTSEDFAKGIKVAIAYRNYLLNRDRGQKAGLYLAPTFRFFSATRTYSSNLQGFHFDNFTQTLSAAFNLGWQFKIKKRLLLDLRLGPELGYMNRIESYAEPRLGDPSSSFDYAGVRLRKIGTNDTKSIWLGLDAAIGVGFIIF